MSTELRAAPLALVRGGGELGTGVAHALRRAGLRVLVVELVLPRALRHRVAFSTAVVEGQITVHGVQAVRCASLGDVEDAWVLGKVAVYAGDELALGVRPDLLVDARMRQLTVPQASLDEAPVTIGIGPGFEAGRDVHYVIESNRGPRLGEVICAGSAEDHSGIPGEVLGHRAERVLRAPRAGVFVRQRLPGDHVEEGDVVGHVDDEPVISRLRGMIRGLKLTGVMVGAQHKVGDVDPRRDRSLLTTMTDKARAVGYGAVSAARLAGLLAAEQEATEPTRQQKGSMSCT